MFLVRVKSIKETVQTKNPISTQTRQKANVDVK